MVCYAIDTIPAFIIDGSGWDGIVSSVSSAEKNALNDAISAVICRFNANDGNCEMMNNSLHHLFNDILRHIVGLRTTAFVSLSPLCSTGRLDYATALCLRMNLHIQGCVEICF